MSPKIKKMVFVFSILIIGTAFSLNILFPAIGPTCKEFKDYPEIFRLAFLQGYLCGLSCSEATNKTTWKKIASSIEGKTPEQLDAIFMKFLKENPEIWHEPAGFHLFMTFSNTLGWMKK